MWIALLFGVLRIAAWTWTRNGDEPLELQQKCSGLEDAYRCLASRCLSCTNFLQPQEGLDEALILQMYADFTSSRDIDPSVWVLNSMIVRTAMTAGYCRDSCSRWHRDVTPYQGEMRRRAWIFVCQAEILFSFQLGLPSMMQSKWLETTLPRNIHDVSFGMQPLQLPESLVDSETTTVSYSIAKAKLVFGFAKVFSEVDENKNFTYTRVLELDREIRGIYQSIPQDCQVDRLEEQALDDTRLVASRLSLANIYHKSICILHSKHLGSAGDDQRFLYFRLACVDSAMTLLSFHVHQHRSPQADRYISYQTSLTLHDYFLAATLLCTALFLGHNALALTVQAGPPGDEIFAALEITLGIFDETSSESVEAHRAYDLLGVLLWELRFPTTAQGTQHSTASSNLAAPTQSSRPTNLAFVVPETLQDTGTSCTSHVEPSLPDLGQNTALPWDEWDPSIMGLNFADPMSFVNGLYE
ncbi:hypothetical protein LTR17_015327 [Elasticomyces elasticus]|nr:hypothetical protein LTR17_015327 [Elasticomyces elasticus]